MAEDATPTRQAVSIKAFQTIAGELQALDTGERVRVLLAVIYLYGLETLFRQQLKP